MTNELPKKLQGILKRTVKYAKAFHVNTNSIGFNAKNSNNGLSGSLSTYIYTNRDYDFVKDEENDKLKKVKLNPKMVYVISQKQYKIIGKFDCTLKDIVSYLKELGLKQIK